MILQKVFLVWYLFRKLILTLIITKKKADIISAVEFDHTGDYLATGDKGGRVVLFERNESVSMDLYMYSLHYWLVSIEKVLRISFSYRVSIPRTRVWLFKEFRDWRKDQPNQMVQETKLGSFLAFY